MINGYGVFGCFIKEGYNMIALIQDECNCYHAIIFRQKLKDYVFCTNYDITDGTWGQGHYCVNRAAAIECMEEYLNRR